MMMMMREREKRERRESFSAYEEIKKRAHSASVRSSIGRVRTERFV